MRRIIVKFNPLTVHFIRTVQGDKSYHNVSEASIKRLDKLLVRLCKSGQMAIQILIIDKQTHLLFEEIDTSEIYWEDNEDTLIAPIYCPQCGNNFELEMDVKYMKEHYGTTSVYSLSLEKWALRCRNCEEVFNGKGELI